MRIMHWVKSTIANVFWYTILRRWGLKNAFNDLYDGQSRSATFRGIFRDALGDQYVSEVDACGFVTHHDLDNVVRWLALGANSDLVDLACGRGGTGLWVARGAGARLVGVDLAERAIETARGRVADFGMTGKAEFRVGDFADTRLEPNRFDGAMSIDALFLVADKTGALRETARILKPGAVFAMTTWEMDMPGGISDYRPMLHGAGFEVVAREVTPEWERRQRGVHEGVLAKQDALEAEMGNAATDVWRKFAQAELPRLPHMRRVFIAARKK